jgi:hypothetical protein
MWSNDPTNALVSVMLSTDAFAGAFPPAGGHPGLLDRRVHRARQRRTHNIDD